MKLFAVEGNSQKLDGGSMFGNAPKALWQRWASPDESNRIPLACRALLLQLDDGRNVLFEVGVGCFFDPKMKDRYGVLEEEHVLLKNLQKLGLSDADIDIIILSHLHFDHAGGLLSPFGEGPIKLLFPRAKVYTGKEHFARATSPHSRDRASFIPLIQNLLQESDRLHLIEGPSHPDLDFLTFRYAHGHTPGLLLSEIRTNFGFPLVFVSDLIPGLPWMHLPITMGYDRFPELVVDEKTAFLNEMIEKEAFLFFTHDPNVACTKIKKDDKEKFYGEAVSLNRV